MPTTTITKTKRRILNKTGRESRLSEMHYAIDYPETARRFDERYPALAPHTVEEREVTVTSTEWRKICDHARTPLDGGMMPRPAPSQCPDCGAGVRWRNGAWRAVPEAEHEHEHEHEHEPAPEVIMDANGNYWRRYADGTLSMCPTSDDNMPLAEPVVVFRRAAS